jgi:sugar phosphate isomerase/epimerase
VASVEHTAVGSCLGVGQAAVAASFFGFDHLEECALGGPLVRHVHLHDNLGHPDLTEGGQSMAFELPAYGIGDLYLPPREPTDRVEPYPGMRRPAGEALATVRGR